MKTRSTLIKFLGTGLVLAALAACEGGGDHDDFPDTPEYNSYVFRHSVMHLLDAETRTINSMYREQEPLDEAEFAKATKNLAALSDMMLDGFANQTIVPESRSKPDIWTNWDDFKAKAQVLTDGAHALADADASGGFEKAKPLVETAVRSCGQCHRSYRAAEEDDD